MHAAHSPSFAQSRGTHYAVVRQLPWRWWLALNMAPKKGAKRAKPSDHLEPEVAVRMLDALQTGELSQADLATAFRADAPGCEPSDKPSTACRGRKDNPNCLCGLVPPAGSFRRKGLWQKDPEAVAKLGVDPADSRREDVSGPHVVHAAHPGYTEGCHCQTARTTCMHNRNVFW